MQNFPLVQSRGCIPWLLAAMKWKMDGQCSLLWKYRRKFKVKIANQKKICYTMVDFEENKYFFKI